MSIFPPESVTVAAQALGLASSMAEDVAPTLAPDVEYRMREVIQEAMKCMRHGKRTTLTVCDVTSGLALRGCEPLLGFLGSLSSALPASLTENAKGAASGAESAQVSGAGGLGSLGFRTAWGHPDVFFIEDRDVDCQEVVGARLPPTPVEVTTSAHWLALEGVQPAIPENVPLKKPLKRKATGWPEGPGTGGGAGAGSGVGVGGAWGSSPGVTGGGGSTGGFGEGPGTGAGAGSGAVELKPAVKHVLSKELQMYLERVVELIILHSRTSPAPGSASASDKAQAKQQQQQQSTASGRLLPHALRSVASDSGLHPLLPYFVHFVADEVMRSLEDVPLLFNLMALVRSLLLNPHLHIEPYLHQLMPSILTCLIAKRIGPSPGGPGQGKTKGALPAQPMAGAHWALRDLAASLITLVCSRYGGAYSSLQPRLSRTLLHTLLDPQRTLPQHYGAVKGIMALGPQAAAQLLLPNLGIYVELLSRELELGSAPVPAPLPSGQPVGPAALARQRKARRAEIQKQQEAWRVWGAVVAALGQSVAYLLSKHKEQVQLLQQQKAHMRVLRREGQGGGAQAGGDTAPAADRDGGLASLQATSSTSGLAPNGVSDAHAAPSSREGSQDAHSALLREQEGGGASCVYLEHLLPEASTRIRLGEGPQLARSLLEEHHQEREERRIQREALGGRPLSELPEVSWTQLGEDREKKREKVMLYFPDAFPTHMDMDFEDAEEDSSLAGAAPEQGSEEQGDEKKGGARDGAKGVPEAGSESDGSGVDGSVARAIQVIGEPLLPFCPGSLHLHMMC